MQPSRAAPKEAARPIYLDNAATTCTDGRVASLIHEMLCEEYGNPSSLHNMGLRAERRVVAARRQVASLAGCREEEVCFTSGATEANNLALIGAARAKARRGRRIVTSQIEHASVLSALDSLAADGFEDVYKRQAPVWRGCPCTRHGWRKSPKSAPPPPCSSR